MGHHYEATSGEKLRQMLMSSGWVQLWERAGRCHLKGPNGNHTGFPIAATIQKRDVQAIAKNKAGWSATEFSELRSQNYDKPEGNPSGKAKA